MLATRENGMLFRDQSPAFVGLSLFRELTAEDLFKAGAPGILENDEQETKITACTYALLGGACLLLLGTADLAGIAGFLESSDAVLLASTGVLLSWVGFRRRHCRLAVGAVGTLFLLIGVFGPALALFSEVPIVHYHAAGESLLAVVFGLLGVLAAALLPDGAEPSRSNPQ